jgi:Arc/MetJ-type ribon-helix-helix transcriptional regulator
MTIEIQDPKLEQLMQDEIRRGRFRNVDDLLTEALQALREKTIRRQGALQPNRQNLAEFC